MTIYNLNTLKQYQRNKLNNQLYITWFTKYTPNISDAFA